MLSEPKFGTSPVGKRIRKRKVSVGWNLNITVCESKVNCIQLPDVEYVAVLNNALLVFGVFESIA